MAVPSATTVNDEPLNYCIDVAAEDSILVGVELADIDSHFCIVGLL